MHRETNWNSLHTLKTDLRYGAHLTIVFGQTSKPIKERRGKPHIPTSIKAYYWKRNSLDIFGKVQKGIILNLSLGGCCLLVPSDHMLDLHSKIRLTFLLDDKWGTKIEREAVVCRVAENQIGCKFTSGANGGEPGFASYISERAAIGTVLKKLATK